VRNRGVISLIAGAKVLQFSESSKSFCNFFQKKLFEGDDTCQILVEIKGARLFEGIARQLVAHADVE